MYSGNLSELGCFEALKGYLISSISIQVLLSIVSMVSAKTEI